MRSFLLWWIDFWKSKQRLFIFFLTLIVGFLAFTALKINLNENINQVFPDKEISKILTSSESKKVFISINTENSEFEIDEIKEAVLFELSNENQLTFLTDQKDKSSFLDVFYQNIPFYLEYSDYTIIKNRIFNLDSILTRNHRSLFSPASDIKKGVVFKDPLGFMSLVTNKYKDVFDISNYSKSSSSEEAILIGNLTSNSIAHVTPVYETLQLIKNKYKGKNIDISFFSISFIPVVNSLQIKKDLKLTLSFTIILILLILLVVFRSYILPFLFVLPAIFGMVFSLALIYWFRGGISAIALGSGAIIFGIVIDYSFHFFSHQKHNKNNSKTIIELYKPLLFSAFTTIMAFYALTLTHSKVLNDFGWFATFGLIGSLLFVLLVLPVISPIPKTSNKQHEFNFTIPNKIGKYLAIGILVLTAFFVFKVGDVSFDSNIEHLNFFPEELKNAEKNILDINSEDDKSILLFVEGDDKEITKERNLDLLLLLKSLKEENKIIKYSNLSLFNLAERDITNKKQLWNDFWERNKKTLKNKIDDFSLKNDYHKNAFDDLFGLIDSTNKFTPLLSNEDVLNELTEENRRGWIAKSMITVKKENKQAVVELLKVNNIKYIDKAGVASKMLVDIKDDFNFLLFYTGILVFLTLLLIYGRFELALITFLPMLISWIWILGICAILDIQFNFVNIIISTLIFGIGDDFAIFISDGYLKKYKTNNDTIKVNLKSIFLSALTTIIALGSLMLAKHPAINSIALISIIGMISILIISFFLQPFLFKWLIINRTDKKLAPITLSNFFSSLFSYTLFAGGSLFLSLLSLLVAFIPYNKKIFKPLFHFLIQKACWLIVFVAINVRRKEFGNNNLNFSKPSLIITNHQSFVDILQMLMLNPKIVLVVKDWVYYSPVFGRLIRYLDFVTISNGIESNLESIQRLIDEGYSIMVFPEGSRSQSEKLGRFHKGAFLIAEKLKLDITPILLHGYGNTIRKNDFLIKKSIVSYKVLPRISWNDENFGVGYRDRSKKIKNYFSKELSEFSKEREDVNYLYGNIRSNIDYKGPIIEWYYKIKWRLEKNNYLYYDSLIPNNARIYDLGCGYGFLSCFLHLRSEEREIIGIDYDSDKVNIAQNYFMFKNLQNLKFSNQNILDAQLENPDVILLNDVLHYLDKKSQSSVLINCFKNLNENGIILIREGEKENKQHIFTKFTELLSTKIFRFNKTDNKLSFISSSDLDDLAKQFSFKIEEFKHSKITSNKLYILRK
jgi:1-acyl-sn-glycerol-3-phosphate acyltransferase